MSKPFPKSIKWGSLGWGQDIDVFKSSQDDSNIHWRLRNTTTGYIWKERNQSSGPNQKNCCKGCIFIR